MGFLKNVLDVLSMGDVDEVLDRRAAESRDQTQDLARSHTCAELESQLAAQRARMPGLLDRGSSREIDDCNRRVGDIMAAIEQQKNWGM